MLTNWCRRTTHRLGRLLGRPGQELGRLGHENEGQDLIEYALLTGIIAIAGILVFPTIQSKMADAYLDWNDNAQVIWETPPPL
jgi:Flp pilus assembly pilin Flp